MNKKNLENQRMTVIARSILMKASILMVAAFLAGCASTDKKIALIPENRIEQLKSQSGIIPDKFQDKIDDIISTMQDDSSQNYMAMNQLCKQGFETIEKGNFAVAGNREATIKLQAYRTFFDSVFNRWLRLDRIKKAHDNYEEAVENGTNRRKIITCGEAYLQVVNEAMAMPELWDASEIYYLKNINNKINNELNLGIADFVNNCAIVDYNAAKSNYDGGRHRWYWLADDNEKLFRAGRLCNRITSDGRVSYNITEQASNLKSQVNSHLNESERRDMDACKMPSYETIYRHPEINADFQALKDKAPNNGIQF